VLVLPQYPYWLQQFPNVDPKQVMVAEQVPSTLMVWATEELEVGAEDVEEVF